MDVTHCCLIVISLVEKEPGCVLRENVVLSLDYVTDLMNSILSVGKEKIITALTRTMQELEEKNQILVLRKVLEMARKMKKEKGVPTNL